MKQKNLKKKKKRRKIEGKQNARSIYIYLGMVNIEKNKKEKRGQKIPSKKKKRTKINLPLSSLLIPFHFIDSPKHTFSNHQPDQPSRSFHYRRTLSMFPFPR